MEPVFFKSQADFRKWLEKNHKSKTELLVGYYKVGSGKPSMTWSQSVDQALCFGWIDGIRRSVDSESYCIRFTPRKTSSNWSRINISKVEDLKKNGLMKQAGLNIFNARKESRSGIYSFENRPAKLPDSYEILFKSNIHAWEFFLNQAPSYRKNIFHWIMSARQEATQISRLNKLIKKCEEKERIY